MTEVIKKKRGPKKGSSYAVRPKHYVVNRIPTIHLFDICDFGFYNGCAVKYLLRHSNRKKRSDLLKAMFYLERACCYSIALATEANRFLKDIYPDKGPYYESINAILAGNRELAISIIKKDILQEEECGNGCAQN